MGICQHYLLCSLTWSVFCFQLKEPEHEIVTLPGDASDEQVTKQVHDIFKRMEKGYGKKILLNIEDTID
jgi:hypothetical protein